MNLGSPHLPNLNVNLTAVDSTTTLPSDTEVTNVTFGTYNQVDHVCKIMKTTSHSLRKAEYCKPSNNARKLRQAVYAGDYNLAKQLLDEGAAVKGADDKKRTAIHIAAAAGHLDIVRLLLDFGADPNQKDIIGNTPLHLATCTHNIPVITLLIQRGCNVSLEDNRGFSPLKMVINRLKSFEQRETAMNFIKHSELYQIACMMKAYLQQVGSDESEGDELDKLCQRLQQVGPATDSCSEQLDLDSQLLMGMAKLKLEQLESKTSKTRN